MSWGVFERIAVVLAFVDSITSAALKVVAQVYTPPGTTMEKSWHVLQKMQTLLQWLLETQWQRIDDAAKKGGKSLKAIEAEFEEWAQAPDAPFRLSTHYCRVCSLCDRYCYLTTEYEESCKRSYLGSFWPSESFQRKVKLLHSDFKALLTDTMVIKILFFDVSPIKSLH